MAAVPHSRSSPSPSPSPSREGRAAPSRGRAAPRRATGAVGARVRPPAGRTSPSDRRRPARFPPDHRPLHLRVVAAPRHTGRYLVLGVLLAAVAVFGTVSLGALAAESTFAAQRLDDEVDELSLRYDELTAEVARLESPGHVRGVARAELGMVPAEQPGYLVDEPPAAPLVADGSDGSGEGTLTAGEVTDRVKQAREGRG